MPIEISELQKLIYNTYLKYLAISLNRPFKSRQNFDNVDNDVLLALVKLETFFVRNPEINLDLYFKVGFNEHPNTYLSIGFFNNFSIIKKYARYIREKYSQDVESPGIVEDFKEGLAFIIQYMKENKCTLTDYINSTNKVGIKNFLIHLKEQKINLFHLHALGIIIDRTFSDEILNIYLEGFREKYFKTKDLYSNSTKIKTIGTKIVTKLKNIN